MFKYIVRRILIGFITLIGITIVSFGVIKLAPGDPAQIMISGIQDKKVSKEQYDRLIKLYGLDKPIPVQYAIWLKRLATGDLGTSFSDKLPVSTKIRRAFGPTLAVEITAIFVAFMISLPIGVYSAVRAGGGFDRSMSAFLYVLYSVPSYVMGILLILYLGVKLDLLPFRSVRSDDFESLSAMGKAADYARHSAMIIFCSAFGSLAYYARFVRGNLLEVIRQDYIRTARAKGLAEWKVIVSHAFRNSMIPLVTLLGLTLPGLISGSVILERMFNWPGLGRLYFDAVMMRDYPVIMALNFYTALLVLVCTLLADLAYGLVDPRVKYE